jgi:MFS family permease
VVGSNLSGLALDVFAVTVLGITEGQLGLLGAAEHMAFLVFALLAGAWVDRWLKRRVMIVADLVRMVCVAAIPLLYFAGVLEFWHLLMLSAIMGTASVFFDVAYQSAVPIFFRDEQIGPANSALETSSQVAGIGGPTIVGFLLTFMKAPFLLLADAASFLVSAITLILIKDDEEPAPAENRQLLRAEIAEGLRFVLGQSLIRRITFTTATTNFFVTLGATMLPIYALRYLAMSVATFGLIMTFAAVGGLLGAMSASRLSTWLGEGQLIVASAALGGLAWLLMPISAFVNHDASPFLIAAGEFLTSFTVLTFNITQLSARQRLCPKPLLGRMNASIRFMVWGVIPLGALAGGLIGDLTNVVVPLIVAAIGNFFAVGWVFFSPLRSMTTMPSSAED